MSQDEYTTQNAKWEAYQFSDPFAATSFVCCNKRHNTVCRPSCDFLPKAGSKEEIEFLTDASEALESGYKPCSHCDPINPDPEVDLALVKLTIDSINASIGFTTDSNDLKKRAFSTPSVSTADGHFNERQLTRNESDHIKLVELACRHIASAAAENVSKQQELEKNQKKKRRGGVLGFKELASKSKLSPWHFHRVFKSVTGLTPKSYGDQCWKFIKNRERPQYGRTRSHFRSNSDITSNYNSRRKVKKEVESIAPTQQPIKREETTPQITESFSFNTNSLDINLTPLRHHSLDLGMVGSMNIDLNNVIISPQFTSMVPPTVATQADVPLPTRDEPRISSMPFQFQQPTPPHLSIVPNDADSSTSSVADGASLSLYPGDESLWPSIQASTPPDDTDKTSTSDANFYDVLVNSSPLENTELFAMNDYSGYALFNADGADSAMLFGEYHDNALFDGITMIKPAAGATESTRDLMV
jgi:methylphosphotriester-DNA--protein-cysteine methyltransferase